MSSNMFGFVRSRTRNIITAFTNFQQLAPCSTALGATKKAEVEEPDKLYKKIEIEMKGNEAETIRSYQRFVQMAANHLGITIEKCWKPERPEIVHDNTLCLLRSAFVHKKHRVQYEFRFYRRYMTFIHLTGSTADTFLEYIERNLPEGVALKVTKVEVRKLPDEVTHPPEEFSEDSELKKEQSS